MSLTVLTLAVIGSPVLLVLLVALALWVRTVRARRRATTSGFTAAAETIRERNNALAPTERTLPLPPPSENGDPHG